MSLIASDKLRVIVGLGVTGLSCARFLASKGLGFVVADNRDAPPALAAFKAEFPEVEVVLGRFTIGQFDGADELYVSPGVSLREPAIASASQAGVRVTGDLDLFAQHASAPIVAITGSNGKSTVTTLVGEMAEAAGRRVAVGGNLGTPMLDLLDDTVELYVVELSSFQLERCAHLGAEVATVLNVSEDHLDHHGSLIAYHQAKHRIFRGCRQAVINRDDMLTQPLVPEDVKVASFGLQKPDRGQFGLLIQEGREYLACDGDALLPCDELRIAGRHNQANALAALALGRAVGLPMAAMLEALTRFGGLPNRCQFIAQVNGVDYFNDSKGTNVGAAVASIEGLGSRYRLVLIAGGQAKGADLSPVADALVKVGRGAVFIGESAQDLLDMVAARIPTVLAQTMQDAVAQAAGIAQSGDAVLLSPACASFDMFDNYEHRGACFVDAVNQLAAGGAHA